jgi:hypothetical protein
LIIDRIWEVTLFTNPFLQLEGVVLHFRDIWVRMANTRADSSLVAPWDSNIIG